MRTAIPKATLSNGKPVWTRRQSGIVTQAMINQHGSFKAALDVLNSRRVG